MASRQSRSSLRSDKMTEQGRSRSLSSRMTPVPTRLNIHGSAMRSRSTDFSRHKKKDPRPINDKIWQLNKLSYVQDYFINHECVTHILNNGKSIRPLTLNMFVSLINILLRQLWDPKIEITIHNYCEVVPNVLNLLRYPGKITNSVLKTANTPHAWPHILAIFSWLIELIERSTNFDTNQITNPDPTDSDEIKISKLRNKACFHAYGLWNDGLKYDSSMEMYLTEYKKLKNVTPETLCSNSTEISRLKESVSEIEENVKAVNEELKDLNTELLDLRRDYDNAKVVSLEQKQYKTKLITKINKKTAEISKIRNEEIDKMKRNNMLLKETISNQTMSVSEKKRLLKEIEDLKVKITLRTKTIDHEQKISDDFDLRLTHLKKKLQETANARNNSLIEPSLRTPQLRELFMPEDNFLDRDMPKIFDEKIKLKQEILSQLEEEERIKKKSVKHLKSLLDLKKKEVDEAKNIVRKELAVKAAKVAEIETFKKEIKEAEMSLLQQIEEHTQQKWNLDNENQLIKEKQKQLDLLMEKLQNRAAQEAIRRKAKEDLFWKMQEFNSIEIKRISAVLLQIDSTQNKTLSDLKDCCFEK